MSQLEIVELILLYSFWTTIFFYFSIAVIVRVVIDYITFFRSWFTSEIYKPNRIDLQTYVWKAVHYQSEFKDRVMAREIEVKENIIQEILKERERQDQKWGEQNHSPIEWCAILGEEVGEANKAALETHFEYDGKDDYTEYRKELIQIAAVAIAMIESYDRNRK
ncbi:hypothetical protein LEP1GSC040_0049 [Leptospira santarosai str. 2000030832]|nr:hypothetical protein LEP1GSC040_0049 [Leptospira santarosai str. 2000030832]